MTGKMFDLDNNHTGCGYGHNVHVYRIRQDGRWMYKVRLAYIVNDKVVDAESKPLHRFQAYDNAREWLATLDGRGYVTIDGVMVMRNWK